MTDSYEPDSRVSFHANFPKLQIISSFMKIKHLLFAFLALLPTTCAFSQTKGFVFRQAGNPYLPLWEHVPDGEPRVFEDPDNPGHYRVYIVGSHDTARDRYCGADTHEWSAPVEDLTAWRDEGAIFTYQYEGKWDIMYAPDLVEAKTKDGKKKYFLYPQDHTGGRTPIVCVSDRPDGPFKPVNLSQSGKKAVNRSCLGFDPAVYVEQVTNPRDSDYAIGYRAYGYWGFQRSTAAQLDPVTMFSVRPGSNVIRDLLPAGNGYGQLKHPEVTDYPCLFPGEDKTKFGFFEASSMRRIGNKYVMVYSGYSGPDYGLSSSNSTLRYAYADTPLGPWKNGGVLVDSRAPELDINGECLISTNGGHNTHGSLQEINGQWYVFYHRTPRNGGYARQSMVAPVKVSADIKSVADGGKVIITGYDPYLKDNVWKAKDSKDNEYVGAEVTSEGFHIFGLDPYQFYPAGIACYLSDVLLQQDAWDIWNNNAPVSGVKSGDIVGYKYFGFGGHDKDELGLKAFKGCKKGDYAKLNLWLIPRIGKAFAISVWLDAPSDKGLWHGKKIGEIAIPASDKKELRKYTVDVAQAVEGLKGKHAIYLKAESDNTGKLFNLMGLGFSSKNHDIDYPETPAISITADGKELTLPSTPTAMNADNGYTDFSHYDFAYTSPTLPNIKAASNNKNVKINVSQATAQDSTAVVKFDWKGLVKTYKIKITK